MYHFESKLYSPDFKILKSILYFRTDEVYQYFAYPKTSLMVFNFDQTYNESFFFFF